MYAYQRIISNNSYIHDEQEDNPGKEKEGSLVSSINCDLWLAASRTQGISRANGRAEAADLAGAE